MEAVVPKVKALAMWVWGLHEKPRTCVKASYGHGHKSVTLPLWGGGRQRQEDSLARLFTSIDPDKLKNPFSRE